jgi:hypothetical protein
VPVCQQLHVPLQMGTVPLVIFSVHSEQYSLKPAGAASPSAQTASGPNSPYLTYM